MKEKFFGGVLVIHNKTNIIIYLKNANGMYAVGICQLISLRIENSMGNNGDTNGKEEKRWKKEKAINFS